MTNRKHENDKIGKWSLYGTIVGAFIIGSLYIIGSNGIVPYITDLSSAMITFIIVIVVFFVVIYIANLISEKLIPVALLLLLAGVIYYTERSWQLTMICVVLGALFYLNGLFVKNRRMSKGINITIITLFFLGWIFYK